ncbi:MAG: response regulator transcription factor [Planctomycetota bacterium]
MSFVLIVEDDPTLRRVLRDNFEQSGYQVEVAADGAAGLEIALNERPALIVLDLMLPEINGYEVCRRLRENGVEIPIIMLTAKSEEADLILGLEIGADDYVTKPFSIKELIARAKAFLRRQQKSSPKTWRFGKFELSVESRTLERNGDRLELTPREFDLLSTLVSQAGKALTRDEILNAAWGYDAYVTPRSVDRCVKTLRAKIEDDTRRPRFIQTVREVGYRFEDSVETA